MEEKIKCPKCGSYNIKKVESSEDFLSYKGEGEKAKKSEQKLKQKYRCWNCGNGWEEEIK